MIYEPNDIITNNDYCRKTKLLRIENFLHNFSNDKIEYKNPKLSKIN